MDINKVAYIAVEAGRILLENGAETYRVEETIIRICSAFDVQHADSFVTPTGIMMSVLDNSGRNISIVKRIKKRTVNLDKIDKINQLSRNIVKSNYSLDEIGTKIKEIDNLKRYGKRTTLIFSALSAASFTILFGGKNTDAVISFVIGIVIKYMSIQMSDLDINDFFINVLGGFTASFIALASFHYGIATKFDVVIIGSVMLLVPGLAITNAIRDTIAGDFVAGMTRALDAFLVAIGIAIGSGMIFRMWIAIFGGLH